MRSLFAPLTLPSSVFRSPPLYPVQGRRARARARALKPPLRWRRALRLARALEAAGLEPSLVTAACAVAAALCGQRFGQALRQLAALEASSAQSLRESQ